MLKKILIGVGVMLITLMALGASDCEVETDTSDSPAVTATEVPAVEPEPAVADDECYLTASCPLQNGWDSDAWALSFEAALSIGGGTDYAGCLADSLMLHVTPTELDNLSDAEMEDLATENVVDCFQLREEEPAY